MPPKASKKKEPVLDSWEDMSSESEPEADPTNADTSKKRDTSDNEAPSPPTRSREPSPPPFLPYIATTQAGGSPSGAQNEAPRQRPVKTAATAQRMIAAALGVRVKLTDEQRAYEKAIREKELKRRQKEKEAKAKAEEERPKESWGFDA